ncbi:MAG: FkbM family methyltransferase [Candidatus Paceibacterota bacterium]
MNLSQLQSFENRISKFLAERISVKNMIDVGAHTGTTLRYFLTNSFNVYAFEPVEQNLSKLIENYKGFKNLFVFSEALSDSSGLKDFYLALDSDNTIHEFYHSLEKIPDDNYHKKGSVIKIKTASIDDLIKSGKIPDSIGYLKIDTEGHDLKVLEGASKLTCQVISIEYWGTQHPLGISPSPPHKMMDLLERRGYKYCIVIKHTKEGVSFYSNRPRFDDDSWGNILFFNESNSELFKSTLEFCEGLSRRAKANSMFTLLAKIFNDNCIFIDVGAYVGDFTEAMLKYFPLAKGFLFEPTKSSYELLKNKFDNKSNINIVNCALDIETGHKKFFETKDSAQNSILQFESKNIYFNESEIEINTLDNFFFNLKGVERIDLIKIDTQGNDLNILTGGLDIIKKYSPAILTEFIFIPLYKNQGSYFDQLMFLNNLDYKLAGTYNVHYNECGCIAFADYLFLPSNIYNKISKSLFQFSKFNCIDPEFLLEENKKLNAICEERLRLINNLSEEAEKRLQIINTLSVELEKLKEKKQ